MTGNVQGKYVVAIDPLDGFSNIDVNVSIGTIFLPYTYGRSARVARWRPGAQRRFFAGWPGPDGGGLLSI